MYREIHLSRAERCSKFILDRVDGGTVDLCSVDPGFEVDLYVRGALRSMTSVWMGVSTLKDEIGGGQHRTNGR